MIFSTALNRSARSNLLYISIGPNLDTDASDARFRTQQIPRFIHREAINNPTKMYTIVLITPNWTRGYPEVVFRVHGDFTSAHKHTFSPTNAPNLKIRIVTAFLLPDDIPTLVTYFNNHPRQRIIIGDFTQVGPWNPFEHVKGLREAMTNRDNVYLIDHPENENMLVQLIA